MVERQKRLKEVFEYVRKNCGIHTQIDFAESLHKSRNAISLALNGNELYLTDKLFKNICEAYPGMFNIDYLLTGEGSLLMDQKEETKSEVEKPSALELSYIIESMEKKSNKTIELLEATIRDKDRIIQLLENEIRGLKLDAERQRSISGYTDIMSNLVSEPKTTKNDDL